MESSDSGISLYIHVPFCADKCLYCDFYSVPRHTVSRELQKRVVEETVRQAKAFLEVLPAGAPIPTIFMGGGTPSSLPRELLAELLQPFCFPSCKEWTLEANPESLDESFLDICHSAGATRISVGVQSLRDEQLRLLKRPATRHDTLTALRLVARKWRGDLSVDYIAGIPLQTPRQVREDIAVLKDFGPSHFSLYQLTCEPDTELAALVEQGKIELNSPDRDEELWFEGRDSLQSSGYEHYEISNFSLPGKECLHNLRYWRMEPYLGAGPGAVSTLPTRPFGDVLQESGEGARREAVLRLSNPRDIHAFTEDPRGRWGMTEEVVAPADFLLENLMMGLRLERGISMAAFDKRFGMSFDEIFPGLWSTWMERGLAESQQSSLRLSDGGRLVLDALLGEIMERLAAPAVAGLTIRWP